MSKTLERDWLLSGTQIFLTVIMWLLIVATVALVTGAGVFIIVSLNAAFGWATIPLAWPAAQALLVVVLLGLGALLAWCSARIAKLLRALVASVATDPFIPANADRLERMGWLAVAIECVKLAVTTVASQITISAVGIRHHGFELQLESVVLILLLFILARVFRQGVAMRGELEGTV